MSFVFGVGIESVIRFDDINAINKIRSKNAVPFINFTSVDPIKKIFGLEDSIKMKLLNNIRPQQLAVDSMINYREYAGHMQSILAKIRKKSLFKNSKQSKMWSLGTSNLTELDQLRNAIIQTIASDIEV